jgi:ABC-type transporter Mla MlaB component
MLKITPQPDASHGVLLRVEGSLSGPWVTELATACRQILDDRGRVALDLSALVYVDRAGAELLEKLQGNRRLELRSVSAFVAEMLKGGAA